MGDMPNVEITTPRSCRDIIEPIDTIDLMDKMFRAIDEANEDPEEYIKRIKSDLSAWEIHFANKAAVKRIA